MILLFIGAGALGQLFAGKISISNPDLPIYVFVSQRFKNAIRSRGILLENLEMEEESAPGVMVGSELDIIEFDEKTEDLHVFITAKAYSNESIAYQYQDYLNKAKSLVILQNGIGNEEIFERLFPDLSIYRMTTSNGALMLENGIVRHTGKGVTYLGAVKNGVESHLRLFYELINEAHFPIIISKNINKFVWEKLIVNVTINAVGALTRNKNGFILESDDLISLLKIIFDEAVKVAYAECIDLGIERDLFERILDILDRTKNNKNSMLADVEHDRPTEIDYLNGKISEWGEYHGIETPINDVITILIRNYNLENNNDE